MGSFKNTCFVCNKKLSDGNYEINQQVFLPVCMQCRETENERKKIAECLDSLADGLICGCI